MSNYSRKLICKHCGIEFITESVNYKALSGKKYCSDKCKRESANQKNNKRSEKIHRINTLVAKENKSQDDLFLICDLCFDLFKESNVVDKTIKAFDVIKSYNIIDNEILNLFSEEKLYNFIKADNENFKNICPICNKQSIVFISFHRGYKGKTCKNVECQLKQRSNSILGDKNPFHRITDENRKEMGKKISKKIKAKIANGTFTPNITNSWCKSKISVLISRNGEQVKVNVRSSWEALFQIINPYCLFEKLRIPYEINNNIKNYIVDFIDTKRKIVYELKPSTLVDNTINQIKFESLKKWAAVNNYKVEIITEDFIKKQYREDLIKDQPEYLKLKRLLSKII